MTLVSGDGIFQGNLGPEQNCWSWKNCSSDSSRGGIWGAWGQVRQGRTHRNRRAEGRQGQASPRSSPGQQRVCCRPWEGESGRIWLAPAGAWGLPCRLFPLVLVQVGGGEVWGLTTGAKALFCFTAETMLAGEKEKMPEELLQLEGRLVEEAMVGLDGTTKGQGEKKNQCLSRYPDTQPLSSHPDTHPAQATLLAGAFPELSGSCQLSSFGTWHVFPFVGGDHDLWCVYCRPTMCQAVYQSISGQEARVFLQKEQCHIIASTVSMAHSGESGKGNQRRFHGGGVKGSISGRPILPEVLAKGLGIQEAGGGLTGRVWSLVEGEV